MIEFLKGLKKFSISTIIVSAVLGVLFIAFPGKCIQYISLFVGAALIVIGAVAVVTYLLDKNTILPLVLGIIVLVTGIVICAKYRQIISIIVVIFGIFILISGLVDFVASFKSIAILRLSGWFTLVLSVITIIFGIVAITKSAALTDSIVRFIGAALIIYAVLDLVSFIQVNAMAKKIKQKIDAQSDIIVEAQEKD